MHITINRAWKVKHTQIHMHTVIDKTTKLKWRQRKSSYGNGTSMKWHANFTKVIDIRLEIKIYSHAQIVFILKHGNKQISKWQKKYVEKLLSEEKNTNKWQSWFMSCRSFLFSHFITQRIKFVLTKCYAKNVRLHECNNYLNFSMKITTRSRLILMDLLWKVVNNC